MHGNVPEPVKISVLLPVFNAGLPLHLAIRSILAQNFSPFEFLIIDDASTDGSADVIREYAGRDTRIRAVYHTSNQGLACTLNEGLATAQGDWIVRMDQDDESLPQRLNIQCRFMESNPEVVVAGSYVFHMGINRRRDRLITLPISHSDIARTLLTQNCIYHPSVILRRKEILYLGGYRAEFKNAEDYDLWLRVSNRHRLANIPAATIRYRFSISGMTLSRKWEQLYFVFLAQVAHENPERSISACDKEARERLDSIERASFMRCVVKGTAEELLRLGYFRETCKLIRNFSGDMGMKETVSFLLRRFFQKVFPG